MFIYWESEQGMRWGDFNQKYNQKYNIMTMFLKSKGNMARC